MGKRRCAYTGLYIHHYPEPQSDHPTYIFKEVRKLTKIMNSYFWSAYSSINGNYVAVTVFLMVLLSFMLPDISQKFQRSHELKEMKKTLDIVTQEVSRAEVACLAVAEQIVNIQCSMQDGTTETVSDQQELGVCTSASLPITRSAPVQPDIKFGFLRRMFGGHRNTSNKEITLMSYVYTDSFNNTNNNIKN